MSQNNNYRYWAYSNYIVSLSRLIHIEYPSVEHLALSMAGLKGVQDIHRRTVNEQEIGKQLRMSWLTELLLRESVDDTHLLPYAAPWSMVHCYYAIYPLLRSYFLAMDREVGDNHTKMLKTISNDIATHQERFPSPWRCVVNGDTKSIPFSIVNTSCAGSKILTLQSALKSPIFSDPCQHYILFLKTTRERQINSRRDEWIREHHKKRLPGKERHNIVANLPATTFFNALYRIRTRSNYLDVDSFLFSGADIDDFRELQSSICEVVFYTMFLFEFLILRSVGQQVSSNFVIEFTNTKIGMPAKDTVMKRFTIMQGV